VLDDLSYGQGHDGDRSNRDILGGGKELGEVINVTIE